MVIFRIPVPSTAKFILEKLLKIATIAMLYDQFIFIKLRIL